MPPEPAGRPRAVASFNPSLMITYRMFAVMGGESWEAHAARPLAASPIFSALAVSQQALALRRALD